MSQKPSPKPDPDQAAMLAGIAAAPARFGAFQGLERLGDAAAADAERLARQFGDDIERPAEAAARLAALRSELARQDLAGFIVPLTDEYHGEYLPRRAQRLTWLTGFTGSAGLAIVLRDRAAIWSDGRYTLQLRDQVDGNLYSRHHITEEPPTDWLKDWLQPGDRFGFDPWLHTIDGVARLKDAAKQAGAMLVAVAENPVDKIWREQPPPPLAPVTVHEAAYAGEASESKRRRIADELARKQVFAAILTLPESIAWLLNIRGGDVPHTPLPLSMALLRSDASMELFIDRRKLSAPVLAHLGSQVTVRPPVDFEAALASLKDRTILADPATAPARVFERLEAAGAIVRRGDDPCLLPKACKNATELAGTRAAHRRDGAAVSRFLAWLSREGTAGEIDEIAAADKLQAFRRQNELIQDLSFTTISGAGPNGAIVHYRVTLATNRRLEPGQLYLVDSGAQYLDGTTDITRTVAISTPSDEMRDRFTRVLKGHIALATVRFPAGTSGSQLDILARHALWQAGLDYDHGTGHGVGSYLGVHEGPQRISKLPNNVGLRPGMIVSNEPGYYKADAYGIRIENLVAVTEIEIPGAERPMLGFETLTRAPIDRNLVDRTLLSDAELAWLNDYHAQVQSELAPLVDAETQTWLAQATEPLR